MLSDEELQKIKKVIDDNYFSIQMFFEKHSFNIHSPTTILLGLGPFDNYIIKTDLQNFNKVEIRQRVFYGDIRIATYDYQSRYFNFTLAENSDTIQYDKFIEMFNAFLLIVNDAIGVNEINENLLDI